MPKMIKVKWQKVKVNKSQNGKSRSKSRNKSKLKQQKVTGFLWLKYGKEVKCKESEAENMKQLNATQFDNFPFTVVLGRDDYRG